MSIEFSENFLKEMTETSERSKSNSHRLDEVENEIRTIQEENKAIHEIGRENFKAYVIEECTSQNELYEREEYCRTNK